MSTCAKLPDDLAIAKIPSRSGTYETYPSLFFRGLRILQL